MIAYYPRLQERAAPGLVPKFGGLPWGLPHHLWPVCKECGGPMSHLAQLPYDPVAMPIGEGRVLFIFKCESDNVCSFWEHDGGANAVLDLPRAELGDGPTQPPEPANGDPALVLREIGISGWDAKDDGAPQELEAAFYSYETFDELPGDIAHPHDWASAWRTKSGGVPYWTANGAQAQPEIPRGRLLLQIDNWLEVDGNSVEIANFCLDGTAYVFVDSAGAEPVYTMFINR